MIEEVYEKTKMAIKEFKNNPVHNLAILLPVFMSLFMLICGEKLKNCGYQFKWSFEEALADWFEDNDRQGLK